MNASVVVDIVVGIACVGTGIVEDSRLVVGMDGCIVVVGTVVDTDIVFVGMAGIVGLGMVGIVGGKRLMVEVLAGLVVDALVSTIAYPFVGIYFP
jgi:hypothetical protein